MGFDRIIALDLGKFKSVACAMHRRRSGQRFAGIVTTPEAMHAFFQSRIEAGDVPSRTRVVFESCDVAGWLLQGSPINGT